MKKSFVNFFTAFILFGFLFSSQVFGQEQEGEIKEITIVSLLSDYAIGNKLPLLFPFKSEKFWVAEVPEWEINDLIQNIMLDFVQTRSKITPEVWEAPSSKFSCFLDQRISKNCWKEFFEEARTNGHKFILLLAPMAVFSDSAWVTDYGELVGNKVNGGYGFYQDENMRCVYALFSIAVIDVEAEKSVGRIKDNDKAGFIKSGFPCYNRRYRDKKTEKKIRWKDSFEKYSNEEQHRMRKYILKGIEEDLVKILPTLKIFKK